MEKPARKRRVAGSSDQGIRATARALLAEQGPEAVTLRAIARRLGITAPALYRYYGSHDELIGHLRRDVVAELGERLAADVAGLPEDAAGQLFALCRGFRRWALANPREFTLVFASPTGNAGSADGSVTTLNEVHEPFGRIFLATAGEVLAAHDLATPPESSVPAELRADLTRFRDGLVAALGASGTTLPPARLDLGTTYLMAQFWARLYGHVTLEVFGNYPITLSAPDAVFDAMLADLARQIGLPGHAGDPSGDRGPTG